MSIFLVQGIYVVLVSTLCMFGVREAQELQAADALAINTYKCFLKSFLETKLTPQSLTYRISRYLKT